MSNRGDLQAIDSLILTCSGWLEQYHANSGVDPNTVGSVVQLQWFGYRIATIGDSPCGGPVCCASTRLGWFVFSPQIATFMQLLALRRQSDVEIWQKSVVSALGNRCPRKSFPVFDQQSELCTPPITSYTALLKSCGALSL